MKRVIACFALGFIITFLAITSPFVVQGYRLAAHADRHGIELRATHGGAIIGANPRAARGEMKVDLAELDRLGARNYCTGPWGSGGLFQSWGTSIYHLLH